MDLYKRFAESPMNNSLTRERISCFRDNLVATCLRYSLYTSQAVPKTGQILECCGMFKSAAAPDICSQ